MAVVTPEFIGRRQRKITLDGVKYKAKVNSVCNGCAFDTPTGCTVTPVSISGGTLCTPSTRDDGTSIIWIKKG